MLYFKSLQADKPEAWRRLGYIGITKTINVTTFYDYRWIGITDLIQKWYLKTFERNTKRRMTKTAVQTVDFVKHKAVEDVTGVVMHVLAEADTWGGRVKVFLSSQDVATAFGCMKQ